MFLCDLSVLSRQFQMFERGSPFPLKTEALTRHHEGIKVMCCWFDSWLLQNISQQNSKKLKKDFFKAN